MSEYGSNRKSHNIIQGKKIDLKGQFDFKIYVGGEEDLC